MNPKSPSSPLVRILAVVGAVVAIVFLTLQQANFLLSRAMLIAFGESESTYRSAWFELDGDITAKDVTIYPYNLGEDVKITFERVHLETPGWIWFVRNTFDRKLKFARMDRIHLTLSGGRSDTGLDPSLGDLGPFGLDSASPFEAEGCAADGFWVREELLQMGLEPELPVLEFDYRVEGATVQTTVALETKGASRVQVDRRSQVDRSINALLLDQYPELMQTEQWTVQDQGFVQARNRHCARKDGVSEAVFIARHAAAVERLLETFGVAVDAASREAYLAFAKRGGQISFGASYTPALHSDEFYELRDTGEAFARMRATLTRDRSIAVQMQHFSPRPLAGLDDGDSTWQAMQRERPRVASVEAAAPVVAAPAIATPVATPPEDPAPAAAVGALSTPSDLASPRITMKAPPSRAQPYLAWNDMAGFAGKRVRLWTVHNPPRNVEVLSVAGDSLRVDTRLGGGNAEYTVQKASFLRARALR